MEQAQSVVLEARNKILSSQYFKKYFMSWEHIYIKSLDFNGVKYSLKCPLIKNYINLYRFIYVLV